LAIQFSLIHWARASSSPAVGGVLTVGGILTVGWVIEPSKCPHKPLASTASWKCIMNAVQFRPFAMSFGTKEGRRSVVVRAVVDMMRIAGSKLRLGCGAQ
jgi:hypothetical protein